MAKDKNTSRVVAELDNVMDADILEFLETTPVSRKDAVIAALRVVNYMRKQSNTIPYYLAAEKKGEFYNEMERLGFGTIEVIPTSPPVPATTVTETVEKPKEVSAKKETPKKKEEPKTSVVEDEDLDELDDALFG